MYRFLTAARFPVGQNIAVTWTTRTNAGASPDFPRQVMGWFNEVRHYGFNSAGLAKGTGHYSQVGNTEVTQTDFSYNQADARFSFFFSFLEHTFMKVQSNLSSGLFYRQKYQRLIYLDDVYCDCDAVNFQYSHNSRGANIKTISVLSDTHSHQNIQ